jgi:hypothetical protein
MIRLWQSLLIAFVLIQGCVPVHYRLIHTVDDKGFQMHSDNLRAVHVNPFNHVIYTTNLSGQKQSTQASQFWGYQNSKGVKYRIYCGNIYEVIQEKTMTVYRQCNYGDGYNDDYFFSINPNESIWYLNTANLRKAFKNDPCMLDLLQRMPLRNWFKTDRIGNFLLLEAFSYCQQQTYREPLITP